MKSYERIISQLADKGGLLRGGVIGSNLLAESRLPIRIDFPQYDALLSNRLRFNEQMKANIAKAREQASSALQIAHNAQSTSIVNAIEEAAKN